MVISTDRTTRALLSAIAVLLAALVVELWSARPPMIPAAAAQVPDSGLQRKQQIDESKRTNELLARLLERIDKGPIRVVVVPDEGRPGKGEQR